MAKPINPPQAGKRNVYICSNDLAVIARAIEEKVAIIIHMVSGSNHAIDTKWPPEFRLLDLDGVDLQGAGDQSMWDGFVCGQHVLGRRYIHKACVTT